MSKTLITTAIGLSLLVTPSFAAHDQADAAKAVDTFATNYAKAIDAQDVAAIVAMFAPMGLRRVQDQSSPTEMTSKSASRRSLLRGFPTCISTSSRCKPKATSSSQSVRSRSS